MKRTNKAAQSTAIFALNSVYYEGAAPQFSFAFNATDMDEAKRKALGWVRYQGMTQSDITVTVASAEQGACIRNEWMNH